VLNLAIELAQRAGEIRVNLTLPGLVALLAGILILVFPRLLNYIVAAYLIVVGVIHIFDVRV
jgi:uncharacterized membrane protein HdeD (DUF308 family)